MRKFIFLFNICMIAVYITAGIAFYFSTLFPQFYGITRLFASMLLSGYGVFRLIVTLKKYKDEKDSETDQG